MNFSEILSQAFRSVRANSLRAILTTLIIAFGIMALVGILTLGSTLARHQLLSQRRFAERSSLVEHDIAGDTIRLTPSVAQYYSTSGVFCLSWSTAVLVSFFG